MLNRRVDIADTRNGSRLFGPFRGHEIVVVNDNAKQLPFSIKSAMWDIMDPKRTDLQLAKHPFVDSDTVMRMVITLPVEPSGLAEIAADVQDQMQREDFSEAYPNLMWSFASANFQHSADDRHMHVSLFFPLQSDIIPSITDIMGEQNAPMQLAGTLQYSGFGSRHFMPVSNGHDRETQYGYVSRGQQIKLERERNRVAMQDDPSPYGGYGNGYGNGAGGDNGRQA